MNIPVTDRSSTPGDLTCLIRRSTARNALLSIIAVLGLASAGGDTIYLIFDHDYQFGLRSLFNLREEENVPAFFSGIMMIAIALVLFLVGIKHDKIKIGRKKIFLLWSLVFIYLSYDEFFHVHELTGLAVSGSGFATRVFYYSWVVSGFIFVALLTLVSLRCLRSLDSETRRRFVTAAAIYLGGALGMEMLGGLRVEGLVGNVNDDVVYVVVASVEEVLEMLGLALFILALLGMIERRVGPILVKIGP